MIKKSLLLTLSFILSASGSDSDGMMQAKVSGNAGSRRSLAQGNLIIKHHRKFLAKKESPETFLSEEKRVDFNDNGAWCEVTYSYPDNLSSEGVDFLSSRARVVAQATVEEIKTSEEFNIYKKKHTNKIYEKTRPTKAVAGILTSVTTGFIAALCYLAADEKTGGSIKQTLICDPEGKSWPTIVTEETPPVYTYNESTRNKLDIGYAIFAAIGTVACAYGLYHGIRYMLTHDKTRNQIKKKIKKEIDFDTAVIENAQSNGDKLMLIQGALAYYQYNGNFYIHSGYAYQFDGPRKYLSEKKHKKQIKNLHDLNKKILLK